MTYKSFLPTGPAENPANQVINPLPVYLTRRRHAIRRHSSGPSFQQRDKLSKDEHLPLLWRPQPSVQYSHPNLQHAPTTFLCRNQFQVTMSLHYSILHPLPRFLRPPVSLSEQLLTPCAVDLLWAYISLYNTVMKVFFIASSVYILYQMKGQYRPTNDFNLDTFKVEFLVLGSFVAAMVFNYAYNMPEVFPSKRGRMLM